MRDTTPDCGRSGDRLQIFEEKAHDLQSWDESDTPRVTTFTPGGDPI